MTEPQPPEPQSAKRKPISIVPIRQQRPDPPSHLSPQEAEIWRSTVRGMRRDWFISPPVQALLRAYCMQVVLADNIERQLRAMRRKHKGSDDAGYRELLRQHIECCKTLLRLATSLRLTPLSNRQSIRDARWQRRRSGRGSEHKTPPFALDDRQLEGCSSRLVARLVAGLSGLGRVLIANRTLSRHRRNDRVRPKAVFGSIHATCPLVTDRVMEAWYHPSIA